jgi:hypothetical protein
LARGNRRRWKQSLRAGQSSRVGVIVDGDSNCRWASNRLWGLPATTHDGRITPETTRDDSNHEQRQLPLAMPATTRCAHIDTRSQQPHTMPATTGDSSTMPTGDASNNTQCQRPRTAPAITHDAAIMQLHRIPATTSDGCNYSDSNNCDASDYGLCQ